MPDIMVDIEADGPIPGDFSMISLGAVVVEDGLNRTFYGELMPISDRWDPEALAVSGHSRETTMSFPSAKETMLKFDEWVASVTPQGDKARFWSDNAGFDWMFVCWYFWRFLDRNPFGFSCTSLTSLYKGLVKDRRSSFKHLRKTRHTHNPTDDARGNAEALMHMRNSMGLR